MMRYHAIHALVFFALLVATAFAAALETVFRGGALPEIPKVTLAVLAAWWADDIADRIARRFS